MNYRSTELFGTINPPQKTQTILTHSKANKQQTYLMAIQQINWERWYKTRERNKSHINNYQYGYLMLSSSNLH